MDIFLNDFVNEAQSIFGKDFIPIHRPILDGNEKQYLLDCINSNFVSSVGEMVEVFENKLAEFTNSNHAIATVNGTSALHIAIQLSGVMPGDEILTQALTFVATCNAMKYAGADPIFVDVDRDTLGLSPVALDIFLKKNAIKTSFGTINKNTGKKISACVPMHTFGFPCRIDQISKICSEWNIVVVEDSAESLGSYIGKQHTGSYSKMSFFSFNGNKIITTGGGGMIITNDPDLAKRAKHITTTAKKTHPYEFIHDDIGYNYRMPNLNAALGCAQMERLNEFLKAKEKLAIHWANFFKNHKVNFVKPLEGNKINYWLNTIIFNNKQEREDFLNYTNKKGVMTRPIWRLMSELPRFKSCQNDQLKNSLWLQDRVVNIPSSVPHSFLN